MSPPAKKNPKGFQLDTGFTKRFGSPKPEPLASGTPKDPTNPYPTQVRAYRALASNNLRFGVCPTGFGKSLVIKTLAWTDMQEELKILIAVPQNNIAAGFYSKDTALGETINHPGGGKQVWNPRKPSQSYKSPVQALRIFLTSPMVPGECQTFICTHAALIRAFKTLPVTPNRDPWAGVSLFIDEGHHSDTTNENELSRIVKHYVDHKSGPLSLFTATDMRMDGQILGEYAPLFKREECFLDEYLEERFKKGSSLTFNFAIGDPIEVLEGLLSADSRKGTFVWIPVMNSAMNPGLRSGFDTKKAWVRDSIKVFKKLGLDYVDLVTPGKARCQDGKQRNQEERLVWLRQRINEDWAPDVVLALELCKEGFDWPEAWRGILLAPRNSNVNTSQMLGRTLRSPVDTKSQKHIEFTIVLPVEPDPEEMTNHLKIILSCLMGQWAFHRKQLLAGKRGPVKKALEKLFGQAAQKRAAEIVVGAVVASGGTATGDDVTNQLMEELFPEITGKVAKEVRAGLEEAGQILRPSSESIDAYSEAMSKRLLRAEDINIDVDLTETWVGTTKVWGLKQGIPDFRAHREACGGREPFLSYEETRALVLPHKFQTRRDYQEYHLQNAPHWPVMPDVTYAGRGWETWGVFLGNGNAKNGHQNFFPYGQAQQVAVAAGIRGKRQYGVWVKTEPTGRMPSDPPKIYGAVWRGFGAFLKTGNVKNGNRVFVSYKKAREKVRSAGIGGQKAYWDWFKLVQPDDMPFNPGSVYAGKGWVSWREFTGTGRGMRVSARNKLPYLKVRVLARSKGFRGEREFKDWVKREHPAGVPADVRRSYKGEFRSYGDFLNTGNLPGRPKAT